MSAHEYELHVDGLIRFFEILKVNICLFVSPSFPPTDYSLIIKNGPNTFWTPPLQVQVILYPFF